MKYLLASIFCVAILTCKAQIKAPKGYHPFKYKNDEGSGQARITNGKIIISVYALGRDMPDYGDDTLLAIGLEQSFNGAKYAKTSDGLYVGTGQSKAGNYYYTIYIPESWTQLTADSKINDESFSDISSWILKQVRLHRKDVYFSK